LFSRTLLEGPIVQPPQHLMHDAGAVILALLAAIAILSALSIELRNGTRPGGEAAQDGD
jgi:hypothetical protein